MNNFTFYSPTMFAFGQGEASRVGALVRQFGGSKVLLVAGGGSVKKNGAYDAVAASLKEAGFPWCELWGVQANPRSGKVYEGIELARTEGVDFLLAIGGGSVIDTAKAIGMGVPYAGDFWDFFRRWQRRLRQLRHHAGGRQSEMGLPQNRPHPAQILRAGPHLHLFPAGLSADLRCGGYAGPPVRALFHQHAGRSPHRPAVRGRDENHCGRCPQGAGGSQ